MLYWDKYIKPESKIVGNKKKVDNNIYSFDIETSSYLILNGEVIAGIEYKDLTKEEQNLCEYYNCMYIWMFSINDVVYYGRKWEELEKFLTLLNNDIPEKKIVFIHNLAFEFQYLSGYFKFEKVVARKSRKVMKCELLNFNVEFRCSYMMSNVALEKLPKQYNLPVRKLVGNLDYTKIRTSITPLTDEELDYCENDCLVVYEYIKVELKEYEYVNKIPLTSTGHVRRELKDKVSKDYNYKRKVSSAISVDPHIYNLLIQSFGGGYTHASWVLANEVLPNVDSYDFVSSYPYILTTHLFPSKEFRKCNIKKVEQMSRKFAYLLVVRFTNLKCRYYNNFISMSKCRSIYNGRYDNGRVISADSLEMTITDIDFYFFLEAYDCEYEILECYYSLYNYLPKQFIDFVLDKYVVKTEYKGVVGKELEYQLEKSKFNALYL